MGAFDSELYALGIRARNRGVSPKSPKKEDKLLYVSWNGTNGGATGKHFDNEQDAIFFANGMAGPCMGTHLWFKPSTKEDTSHD